VPSKRYKSLTEFTEI